ncbi:hypothetical protein DMN91_010269 [Ooceraea biroi]|uniref:Mos1 transposase HTH domain-containing protein n=1 Tax=Ooceraea biroi TaxID=2015173 RepID=A0A3L8DBZ9_OOCBI|nr:hypothetical protein DMN91_010269 [Ooceraea biroi]
MEEQRICIKFCVKNGIKCANVVRMLQTAFGDQAMSQNRVFEWYRRFRDGRENTEDDPRSGRPSTAITDKNVEKVKQIVLANRRIIVRELAEEVEASFESCRKILVDVLGVRRLAAKFVPKLLNF